MALDLFIPERSQNSRQRRVAESLRMYLGAWFSRGDAPPMTLQASEVNEGESSVLTLPVPVTITHVSISPDLKKATIQIMPLGGQEMVKTMLYLDKAKGYIRHSVSTKLGLRHAPALIFVPDQIFESSAHIETIFKEISKS